LSGLDGSSELDQPSPLRLHYQQDTVTPSKVFDSVYMYANDYFVGSPGENMRDLLDVNKLRHAWSIWHETGHMYQQKDWTLTNTVETTVNIYTLAAQAHFGYPSRLKGNDYNDGKSPLDLAAIYLARKSRDFNNDKEMQSAEKDDDRALWVRLVMYDQLRAGLGNNFYPLLHKYYRAHPLDDSVIEDQAAQLQFFILRSSIVSGRDLTTFFGDWGIPISRETAEQLQELKLPPADRNLSHIYLAAVTLGAAAVPAQTGGVRISAIQYRRGRSVSLPFSVTCIDLDGKESESKNYSIWTGTSMVVNGCNKFAMYFTVSGGRRFDYEMTTGHSYYFQWTGSHWEFNEYVKD
jgi:hypothetical protein